MIPRTRLFRGLALVAALGVGLTACDGDDIIVPVEPTISAQPSQLNLRPGETQRVVATITGLDNTAATFESTNSSVATVDADGNVTGVNEGVATITVASVERPSLRTGVGVRVEAQQLPPTEEPSVVIEGLTASGTIFPVDPDSVVGQIDITMAIERGSADELRVRLNGQTIDACSQTFDAAGNITAEDLRIGAVVQTVVCSVNTRAFTREGNRGIPTYPNGALTVEVELLDDGATIASAQRAGFTLQNADFMVAEVAAINRVTNDTITAIGDTGLLWLGNGDLEFTIIPVIYSAQDETGSGYPAQVSIGINGFVDGANAPRSQNSATLVDGGFVVNFPRTDTLGPTNVTSFNTGPDGTLINVTTVTNGGQPGPATDYDLDDAPTEANRVSFVELQSGTALHNSILRFDNEGPDAGDFTLPVHPATGTVLARNGWVNGAVNFFDGKDGENDSPNGIAGVGLPASGAVKIAALRVSATASQPDEVTVIADGIPLPDDDNASSVLDPTLTNSEYVVAAVVRDRLGNSTYITLDRTDPEATTVENESQTGNPLRIGVDRDAPAISVTDTVGTPYNPIDDFKFVVRDTSTAPLTAGPSGIALSGVTPVRYTCGTAANCAPAGTVNASSDTATYAIGANVAEFTKSLLDITTNAYHRLDAFVWDRAGNMTGPISSSVFIRDADTDELVDNDIIVEIAPRVSNVNIPTVAQFVGGQDYSFSARVMDNVDLQRASAGFDFEGDLRIPFEIIPLTVWGTDHIVTDSVLTQEMAYIRALSILEDEENIDPAFAYLQPTHARFRAWDHSLPVGSFSTQANNLVPNTIDPSSRIWFNTEGEGSYGIDLVEWGADHRWVVRGQTGTFNNPFERVLFYARIEGDPDGPIEDLDINGNPIASMPVYYLLGSAAGISVEDTDELIGGRYWRFTPPAIPAQFVQQQVDFTVIAVGVTAAGDALMSTDGRTATGGTF